MGLLMPLYFLGAAAIALPIYLHLRRKPPKDSVEFSSLMFLNPTKHNPQKRERQLENLPLLLARCLALLLLALMFARPFMSMPGSAAESGTGRTVVLIDSSASMQRSGVWEEAMEKAEMAVEQAPPDTEVAVFVARRQQVRHLRQLHVSYMLFSGRLRRPTPAGTARCRV